MMPLLRAALAAAILSAGGCTSLPLNTALGTPKNPTPVFDDATAATSGKD